MEINPHVLLSAFLSEMRFRVRQRLLDNSGLHINETLLQQRRTDQCEICSACNQHFIQAQLIAGIRCPIALDKNDITGRDFKLFSAQMDDSKETSFGAFGDQTIDIVADLLAFLQLCGLFDGFELLLLLAGHGLGDGNAGGLSKNVQAGRSIGDGETHAKSICGGQDVKNLVRYIGCIMNGRVYILLSWPTEDRRLPTKLRNELASIVL